MNYNEPALVLWSICCGEEDTSVCDSTAGKKPPQHLVKKLFDQELPKWKWSFSDCQQLIPFVSLILVCFFFFFLGVDVSIGVSIEK